MHALPSRLGPEITAGEAVRVPTRSEKKVTRSRTVRRRETTTTRRRLPADQAKLEILRAAERHLEQGGPSGVRVQVIARELGLTDAAVHHHFGSRKGLLEALMRHAGRRLKRQALTAVSDWGVEEFDAGKLCDRLGDSYAKRGYARLAMRMLLEGYRPMGSGLYRPLAEAVHATRVKKAREMGRRPPPLEDTLFAVTLLNVVLCADPLIGDSLRQSVGLHSDRATSRRYLRWFADMLQAYLDAAPTS
jgi:AcrR family transcriptional regulator